MEHTPSRHEPNELSTDEVARLAEVQRESVQQAAHRFDSLRRRYEGRQDLAWWPPRPEPDPCAPGNLFFYRPGELLVRAEALPAVRGVLRELGVRTCAPDRHDRHDREPEPVVRILVASRDPVPLLLDRLRCYGLGLDLVGPNHVFFPSTTDTTWSTLRATHHGGPRRPRGPGRGGYHRGLRQRAPRRVQEPSIRLVTTRGARG